MAIDIDSLIGAEIVKTEEDSMTQALIVTLLLENEQESQGTPQRLQFEHVTHYSRSEIPHEGLPVILEVSQQVPEINKSFDNDQNRKRFKIDTTSGIVVLEFEKCEIIA